MKKTYTKKQIQEAISYWEKQLRAGNYKKANESINDAAGILQAIIGNIPKTMSNMSLKSQMLERQMTTHTYVMYQVV